MELIKALKGERTDYTPVWFMRQAGRFLPEYRAIRKRVKDFFELCRNVELSVEVTLLPIRILKVDAAILFSDLLVPLLPLGEVSVELVEKKGPVIECRRPLSELPEMIVPYPAEEHLGFVADIIKGVKREIPDKPLIGFCGAPFTLISYVIEGGGSKTYHNTKKFMYMHPDIFAQAVDRLVDILISFARLQQKAGVDAFQVFDSWAGALSPDDYEHFMFRPTQRLIEAVAATGIPVIYFSTGTCGMLSLFSRYSCDAVSVDWRQRLSFAVDAVGEKAVQGNLDPSALFMEKALLSGRVRQILLDGLKATGHVFNLGHGILPDTDPDVARWLVDFVHEESGRLRRLHTQRP
ncbi:MAG: uroporphyrinogen decarboxylase [Deferribacteres bacterium]|nr:uroporphyrinogen decarboxylase [Deferribacteres bacterium]